MFIRKKNMIKFFVVSFIFLMVLIVCIILVECIVSGDIFVVCVYIKSMIEQVVGLLQISFMCVVGLFNNDMLELVINDVVLVQIVGGECLLIWFKFGSYDFSVKCVNSLGSNVGLIIDKLIL